MSVKLGFIGYGSMGGMLVNGFIKRRVVAASDCIVSGRNPQRLRELQATHGDLRICGRAIDTARAADILFVCVKPMDVLPLLREIRQVLAPDKHLVSLAVCVDIKLMAKIAPCSITRIIPSVTSEVGKGVTLICHDEHVSDADKARLAALLASIGSVREIPERELEIATDLTSCAPGLFAAMFGVYVQEALKLGSLTAAEASDLVMETLYGTALLLEENKIDFDEALSRVATKGGITEAGAGVLKERLPEVFAAAFKATLDKCDALKKKIDEQFVSPQA